MVSTFAHRSLVAATLAAFCLIAGCQQQDGAGGADGGGTGGGGAGDGSAVDLQQAQTEFALGQTGGDQPAQLLDSGVSTENALATLADNLRQDPMIAAAALQDLGLHRATDVAGGYLALTRSSASAGAGARSSPASSPAAGARRPRRSPRP